MIKVAIMFYLFILTFGKILAESMIVSGFQVNLKKNFPYIFTISKTHIMFQTK